ncbi:2873_t:CDS:1, partial [Paraglomus brasilianum]
ARRRYWTIRQFPSSGDCITANEDTLISVPERNDLVSETRWIWNSFRMVKHPPNEQDFGFRAEQM